MRTPIRVRARRFRFAYGRLRARADDWVVRRLFPQRSFITFDHDARLEGATISTTQFGATAITLAEEGVAVGLRCYDVKLHITEPGALVTTCLFHQRNGDDAVLVTVDEAANVPKTLISHCTFRGKP